MSQDYIVRFRVELGKLKEDLARAKQLIKSNSGDEVTIAQARLDRQKILSDIAAIKRQLREFATQSLPPITFKTQVDTRKAREQLASFHRPVKIPTTIDSAAASKQIDKLRFELASVRTDLRNSRIDIPVHLRAPSRNETGAVSRRIRSEIINSTVSITPRVDGRPARAAMGNLRAHARQLAQERPVIRTTADIDATIARLHRVRDEAQRLNRQRVTITPDNGGGGPPQPPSGFFGRRAAMSAAAFAPLPVRAATGIAAGVGALGAAGVGAGAKIAFDGVKGLGELERFKATMATILKDEGKANGLFKELEQVDLDLPVDLSLLASAATKLAGSGFDPSTLTSDLTSILDAASVSTDGVALGSERIVRAFSQIKGQGRLLGEELNQLAETGIPIRAIIQEQFGMTAGELADRSQAGEIDVDTILAGIVAGFEKNFGGNLKRQSEQLGGQLDKLGDKYRAFSREVAKPLFEPLKDALSALNEAIDSQAFDELKAALLGVAEATGPLIQKLAIITRVSTTGAGGVINTGKATANVAGQAATALNRGVGEKLSGTIAKGVSLFAKGAELFGKADTATGGLLSTGIDAATRVAPITAGARLTNDVIGGTANALDGAAEFVAKSQPAPKPKEPPKPQPLPIGDLAASAGEAIKGRFEAITSLLPALASVAAQQASGFAKQNGIDVSRLPEQAMDAAYELRVADNQQARKELLKGDDNKRFDTLVGDLPKRIKDFATTITDPETRKAFEASTFKVKQEDDGTGRMRPVVDTERLGTIRPMQAVERSGFSDLNSLVQSNVDEARGRQIQEKQLSATEQVAKFTEQMADDIRDMKKDNKPRETIVGSN